MPYVNKWIDPPKDLSLQSIPGEKDKPPEGYELMPYWNPPMARSVDLEKSSKEKKPLSYHFCYKCGWVPGEPNDFMENTLGPLCGRMGTTFYCRRCGIELAFNGVMS